MLLRPIPAPTRSPDEKIRLYLAHECAGFSIHPPQLNYPWIRPATPLTGHGLLLMQKLRRPRGYAYPRPGTALQKREGAAHHGEERPNNDLVLLFTSLLPAAFACQCFLHALLLAGLQIKGVALDLLNNVFLLHLALEAAQCIFKGLALLQSDFCQRNYTPKLVQWDCIVIARFCAQVKDYVG